MTTEAIERRYPGLIGALARHPGIGAVIGRSADGSRAAARRRTASADLDAPLPDGRDLLADYGPRAVEALRRLAGFANRRRPDPARRVDAVTGEVTGFEELVGSHGGLGGRQTEPFILCPSVAASWPTVPRLGRRPSIASSWRGGSSCRANGWADGVTDTKPASHRRPTSPDAPTGADGPRVDPGRPVDPKAAELRAEKNPLKRASRLSGPD